MPWIEYYHKGGLVSVEGVHTDSVLQLSLQIKAIKEFSQASLTSPANVLLSARRTLL